MYRTPLAAGFALAAAIGLAPAAQASIGGGTPVVIDTFATSQSALSLTFPPAGTTASSGVAGPAAELIGGARALAVNLNSGVIAGNTTSAAVSSGFLSYSQDATISGIGLITWDGNTDTVLDTSGLGSVDLTAGGTQNALALSTFFDDLPANVTITVHSGSAASAYTTALPGLIFSATPFVIPFSLFTTTAGAGADFAHVGAITLSMGSAVTAPDIVLDDLNTDALLKPSLAATLSNDLNLDGLAGAGDEITYDGVISNPDDATNAGAPGTVFTVTPDASSSLVVGSVTTGQGAVTSGNTGGDTSVAVTVGAIADGANAAVRFKVHVKPGPTSPLSVQGTVAGGGLTALKTDDLGVLGAADPTLTPVVENVAPIAHADAYDAVAGTPLIVVATGVLANDTDADGGSLTLTGATMPAHGTLVTSADGGFTYTPAASYAGDDTFTYSASDGADDSPAATVTLHVAAPVPPPPPTPTPPETPAPPPMVTPPVPQPCVSQRTVGLRLPARSRRATRATVRIGSRRAVSVHVRAGRIIVDLRKLPKGSYKVAILVGGHVVARRTYQTCMPGARTR